MYIILFYVIIDLMIEKIDKAIDVVSGACSLALVADEQAWTERNRRLNRSESTGKHKLAARVLHELVNINPALVKGLLSLPYERQGIEVIGMGYTSTVVKRGDSAVKLIRATERMSEDEQRMKICELQGCQDILLNHFDDFAIPQDFDIIEHPLRKTGIVASIQPIVEKFTPLRINCADGFSELSEKQKVIVNNFAGRAISMAQQTGWVPDVLGTDNFGFDGGEESFVIIDTIPSPLRPEPDMSLEYIDRIAAAVQQ